MQTFLPYPSFEQSAKCLDYRRLGKQRLEAKTIYNLLTNATTSKGWRKHPATKMWEGYENALACYYNCIVEEWVRRGYENSMPLLDVVTPRVMPYWFGSEDFHASHRSNLLRKDAEFYSKYGWTESNDLDYVWPTKV